MAYFLHDSLLVKQPKADQPRMCGDDPCSGSVASSSQDEHKRVAVSLGQPLEKGRAFRQFHAPFFAGRDAQTDTKQPQRGSRDRDGRHVQVSQGHEEAETRFNSFEVSQLSIS